MGPPSVVMGLVLGQDRPQMRSPKISIRSVTSVRAVSMNRSANALPRTSTWRASSRLALLRWQLRPAARPVLADAIAASQAVIIGGESGIACADEPIG